MRSRGRAVRGGAGWDPGQDLEGPSPAVTTPTGLCAKAVAAWNSTAGMVLIRNPSSTTVTLSPPRFFSVTCSGPSATMPSRLGVPMGMRRGH